MAFRSTHSVSRRAGWLAIFALLLQTLIPALHHPASMALGAMAASDNGKNICLAPAGPADAPASPDKAPQHHQMPACALCQAVHAIGGFAPPAAMAAMSADMVSDPADILQPALLLPQRPREISQPRGPPASI